MNEAHIEKAALTIASERGRQVEEEKWDHAHDDAHTDGSLWRAAYFYTQVALKPAIWAYLNFKQWPWGPEWFKPWKKNGFGNYTTEIDQERCLVKAGALILAEQSRLNSALEKVTLKLAEIQYQKSNQ